MNDNLAFRQLKSNLKEKLESLEKKVLLGGENLLEKAEAQEKLLEKSAKELEQRRKEEAQLKQALEEKEVSRQFWRIPLNCISLNLNLNF